jgi:putative transposase
MPQYRRCVIPGATYFFTLALRDRTSSLLVDEIERLRSAYKKALAKLPVTTVAIAVMPEHIHAIWTMPPDEADYSRRWNMIKGAFSKGLPATPSRSASEVGKREKGIWQRRFWEHRIRDDEDLQRCIDYIHFNPVKHRLVKQAVEWPYTSFHRYVKQGLLPVDWGAALDPVGENFGE